MRYFLKEFTYEKAKIAMYCQGMLSKEDIAFPEPAKYTDGPEKGQPKPEYREKYFRTTFKLFEKPSMETIMQEFNDGEWQEIVGKLKPPKANRFIPRNVASYVKERKLKDKNGKDMQKNEPPGCGIKLDENKKVTLYFTQDQIYLKPNAVIAIILRIKQPHNRFNEHERPNTFLESPKDFALFRVMKDCLKQTVINKIGYEAMLAHMKYSLSSLDDIAVKIEVSGYSDRLFEFAGLFLDILFECAESGFKK